MDWDGIERQLERAGATGYQLQKTTEGYRFSAEVRGQMILGRGATPGEAIGNLLGQLAR